MPAGQQQASRDVQVAVKAAYQAFNNSYSPCWKQRHRVVLPCSWNKWNFIPSSVSPLRVKKGSFEVSTGTPCTLKSKGSFAWPSASSATPRLSE